MLETSSFTFRLVFLKMTLLFSNDITSFVANCCFKFGFTLINKIFEVFSKKLHYTYKYIKNIQREQ